MKYSILIILLLAGQMLFGQDTSLTFSNFGKPIISERFQEPWFSSNIHEITLNANSTFEFWSRPYVSCFTWHHYEGTWKKNGDTIIFHDSYEIMEDDVRATYQNNSDDSFLLSFRTDQHSILKNKKIKLQYNYDFDAHIDDVEKICTLSSDNKLKIPFKDIPNMQQLAAIRIEYLLNDKEKRYGYLTKNNPLNKKTTNVPNLISVEFVEHPKKETVYRTTKAVIQNDKLFIISTERTKTMLPDYYGDLKFENGYSLNKR